MLKKKLAAVVAINLLLTGIIGLLGIYAISLLNPENSRVLKELDRTRYVMQGDMMHDALRGDALRALLVSQTGDEALGSEAEIKEEIKDHSETFSAALVSLEALSTDPESIAALAKLKPVIAAYVEAARTVLAARADRVRSLALYNDFQKSFEELEDLMEAMSGIVDKNADRVLAAETASAAWYKSGIIVVLCIAILVGVAVSYFVVRSTVSVIEANVQHLTQSSTELGSEASQIDAQSRELSSSSAEQSAAVQETMASMSEMESMLKQTNDYSSASLTAAQGMVVKTERGAGTMSKLVRSMEGIQEANQQLLAISGIIEQISSKTAVINDIVFKTQLLSFNASIEAARAGQHGRGFAVVAEEVGNLAELSGSSAREIENLLRDSRQQVQGILDMVKSKVSEGESVAQEAAGIFSEIKREGESIVGCIEKIANAAEQQETGVQQISTAMSEIGQSAEGIRRVASTLLGNAQSLLHRGESLNGTVGEFKLLTGDTKSTSRTGVRHPQPRATAPSYPDMSQAPANPRNGVSSPPRPDADMDQYFRSLV